MKASNAPTNGNEVFDEPMLKAHMLVAGGSTYETKRNYARSHHIKRTVSWIAIVTAAVWTAGILIVSMLDHAP